MYKEFNNLVNSAVSSASINKGQHDFPVDGPTKMFFFVFFNTVRFCYLMQLHC